MSSLWLVVPVHGREGITRVCLEQKTHLAAELAASGIRLDVLVVGNDANLNTARELGFHTLERPNVPLGRKLNDGFEQACREGGADYVSFVGSDDWLLASFLADLPEPDRVRSPMHQAFVSPTGDRLIVRLAGGWMGGAPWVIPAPMLAERGYRPVWVEHKMNGMDFLIYRTLAPKPLPRVKGAPAPNMEQRRAQKLRELHVFDKRPADPLRMVDFKTTGEQITEWHTVLPKHRGAKLVVDVEGEEVWSTLATRYPVELVQRMQALYANGLA